MDSKKAHFIGIAGKGMSATALLLREMGWTISGSDEGFYPPVSDYLHTAGISFAEGYRAENIPSDTDIIVIGKNAKLVPESNEEVAAAFASGKPIRSFADILEELTAGTETMVVAGSYGKSTCTALLAWCLQEAGKDPSYFIGEVTKGFASYAHKGGSLFVLEGDEYPSANWDATSKFLHYNARTVLLTSATHDHFNIFPTHEQYLAPFQALLRSLPHDGLLIANAGEPYAKELSQGLPVRTVYYSLTGPSGWYARNIQYGGITTFELMHDSVKVAELSTSLLGAHNVENIVGVAALLLEKNLLTPEELATGIATFAGVKRRLEHLSPRSRVPVLEGFGSSYEKAKSAIAAVKLHFPHKRLVVVFEPHTFSWRNREALPWYDDVFTGAAEAYIFEPATQGATTHAQLTQDEIVTRIHQAGITAHPVHTSEETLDRLAKTLTENDVVLLLTSGGLGGLIEHIPELAEELFPL